MIVVHLPLPPSVNRLWRSVGRRVIKSPEYRAWINQAGYALNQQHPGSIKGRVELTYAVGKTRRDLGNLEKAATDLLVNHGVIEDDGPNIVRRIVSELDPSVGEGVRVTIRPYVSSPEQAVWG